MHPHRARTLAWVFLKKESVHISAQRVPYLGTVSGHQVWTLPYKVLYIEQARAKSETLVNNTLILNRVMLNGERNENGIKINTNN